MMSRDGSSPERWCCPSTERTTTMKKTRSGGADFDSTGRAGFHSGCKSVFAGGGIGPLDLHCRFRGGGRDSCEGDSGEIESQRRKGEETHGGGERSDGGITLTTSEVLLPIFPPVHFFPDEFRHFLTAFEVHHVTKPEPHQIGRACCDHFVSVEPH